MLAYYYFPYADNHKIIEYTAEDLSTSQQIEELFDYCQILEAYITPDGWQFLIEKYGWEKLFEINNKSGWFWAEDVEDYKLYVQEDIKSYPK